MKLTMQRADESGYPERKPIPDNSFFEAIILDISENESPWDIDENDPSKGKKMQLSWKFKILDPSGEFDDRYVWGNTSTYFATSANNKLRQWIQAALDIPVLPEGYAVDTEQLHDKQCLVIVSAKNKANGGIANRVMEIQPSRVTAPLNVEAAAPTTEATASPTAEEFRAQNAPSDGDLEAF
jgi:hypothetical protein